MWVLYYVAGRWMKVPAAKLVWSFTLGREGLSGLPHHKKPAQSGFAEGWLIYPPYRMRVPFPSGNTQIREPGKAIRRIVTVLALKGS